MYKNQYKIRQEFHKSSGISKSNHSAVFLDLTFESHQPSPTNCVHRVTPSVKLRSIDSPVRREHCSCRRGGRPCCSGAETRRNRWPSTNGSCGRCWSSRIRRLRRRCRHPKSICGTVPPFRGRDMQGRKNMRFR